MSEVKEKPLGCPFCGRDPISSYRATASYDRSGTGQIHFLSCMCGGFSARAHQYGDTYEEVLAKWNTRHK